MDQKLLENLIRANLSSHQIAKRLNKSQTTIRYWLKKYNLKTNKTKPNPVTSYDNKVCARCNDMKPMTDYYTYRGRARSWCKACDNHYTIERQRRRKLELINYKGGACIRCGYNKCPGALEFHHRDPTYKEFTLSSAKLKFFSEDIKKELDKCILLCSNCHREEHWN